jgi:hypothetical protein
MRSGPLGLLALSSVLSVASLVGRARADTLTIRNEGDHPRYSFEAEPHLLLGFLDPPGAAHGTGVGLGFRGTVTVLKNGFIPSLNNSIGIGFGFDWVHYGHGQNRCVVDPGFAGGCIGYDDSQSLSNLWLPVVMQWNFWLSRQWSVFGEPGLGLRYQAEARGHQWHLDFPELYLGGRFHLADTVTITLRGGFPTFSAGVSFLL